ncbi:unnamed protein product [Bursaphelenchus okinawaensis]|uniref:Neur_chan_LBD domain-containing protein n=1 Tax=Bursaphelenchus okinawaensis TaxID=465554 RepID=A0A811KT52_9BILA|nr:unnamed protein product [Bursaphelenchus okinawaensis]CAG9110757.1 unnamed protein product [Bursaphelenchus okinawaensis]
MAMMHHCTPLLLVFMRTLMLVQAGEKVGGHIDLTSIMRRNKYYNNHAVPTTGQGKPTRVTVQMYIEGMSSFRAQTMDFHIDCYLQLRWVDARLAHNGSERILVKDMNLYGLIWHPDLYFANARTASFHDVTSPNFLVWIYSNGTVFYDARISMTVICMLHLARYPLDSQGCSLRILSYPYDVESLIIEWSSNGVMTNPEIRMPDMKLREIIPAVRNDSYATGNWSCATAEFIVDRLLMHHIIQSYVPQSLIVVISWISFWLDVEAVPGRVSLSITTLLTLSTQSSAERMSLPQASYVKASDVFGGACMAFVFLALIEFTIVNYCTRRKIHEKMPVKDCLSAQAKRMAEEYHERMRIKQEMHMSLLPDRNGNGVHNGANFFTRMGDESPSETNNNNNERQNLFRRSNDPISGFPLPFPTPGFGKDAVKINYKKAQRQQRMEMNRKVAQTIDLHCRFWFPFSFVMFNIVYWTYYLYINPKDI